ncbi:PH domain-containing protein [Priestia sp. FSL W8-0524]|uniref:PH domain-containing protein n=1 Tax=Priestia sp. FSL W8-0524 TaxID=2954625 RepID=UPI0030FA6B3C
MSTKYTKLNSRFGIIEYPVSLEEMKEVILELPKTERKFYEIALKPLQTSMSKNEQILLFTIADAKLTKTGFMVITDKNLYLISLKGGLFGGAEIETLKYADIKNVDFDITPNLFGMAQLELGVLYLEIKGLFGGGKKRTIRNIPEEKVDKIVSLVREQVKIHNK